MVEKGSSSGKRKIPYFEEDNNVKVKFLNEKEIKLFRSINGCFLELTKTRPEIIYYVSKLISKNIKPTDLDARNQKILIRYLKGAINQGIVFRVPLDSKSIVVECKAYSDADWAGDISDYKSRNGFVFLVNGGAVLYMTRKQLEVALSSCESEYVGLFDCIKEARWFIQLLLD